MTIGQFRPTIGGAERQCEILARALIARGHDVMVLTVRPTLALPIHEIVDGVPLERVAYPILYIAGRRIGFGVLAWCMFTWRVWRLLPAYDVVVAHQALWPTFAACVAARLRRKSVVCKIGNSGERFDFDVLQRTHWYGGFAVRYLRRHIERFIATSAAVQDDLLASGVPPERVAAIPNGVAVPVAVSSRAIDGRVRFVAVGTLTPKKNFRALIDAAAQLDASHRARCTVTIAGDGPLGSMLRAHVTALDIAAVVTFVGEVRDIPKLLTAHDVFVLPSRTEGLSNATLEAMAHGLPLILSDAGGNRDLVPDAVARDGASFMIGTSGMRVPLHDSDALTAALRWMCAHADERMRMGIAARALVEERYAITAIAARYEQLLAAVVCPAPRVVHLLTFFDSQTGGMERQALQLARALRVQGLSVWFITCVHAWRSRERRMPFRGTVDEFRVYRIPFLRGWQRLNAVVYVLTSLVLLVVFRRRYDVIHAHQLQTSGVVASVARRLLPRKRVLVKDACSGAFGDVGNLKAQFGPRGAAFVARGWDRCIGTSEESVAEMRAIGCTRVLRIPNGVDTKVFRSPSTEDRNEARAEVLGSGHSTLRLVLAVGRLHAQKDLATLIDACAQLGPEYFLCMVGDGPERYALERRVRERNVAARVRFVGAVSDVRPYYYAADVFVLTSRSEGMPNAVLEAMACGLPIVASHISVMRAIVRDACEGYLVAPGDVQGFARAIRTVTRDVGDVRVMGDRARARAMTEFGLSAVVERYATLYHALRDS